MSNCRYCGSGNYGRNCPYGPNNTHYHNQEDNGEACLYCGTTYYGTNCAYSPEKKDSSDSFGIHKHGHGQDKCIYCGSYASGSGCAYSPSGHHVK